VLVNSRSLLWVSYGTLWGQNVQFLALELAVHRASTGLWRLSVPLNSWSTKFLNSLQWIVDEWKTNLMSLAILFHLCVLNMFRTLIYPSSGACGCVDELPHRSSCSQFVVCWSFWCGWFLVVFDLQAEAAPKSPTHNELRTKRRMW
jgi:hypothetical protein